MSIIGILFDIVFHLVEAIFELIFGIISTIIQFLGVPILIIIAIWLIYLYIKVKGLELDTPKVIKIDGASIGYATEPPNFRSVFPNEFGIRNSCGTCIHCGDPRCEIVVCTKYGVKYKGHGCLDKTVCDDYLDVLIDDLSSNSD